MDCLVIALRPQWCNLILSGSKTIELRRQCPRRLDKGMRVLLYSHGHIHGEAVLCGWDRCGTGEDIARRHWRGSQLRQDEATAYLAGARCPGALYLTNAHRYPQPQQWRGSVPQNFLYA